MFRIDVDDDSGRFTEGSVTLGDPATVVTADLMNALQEEVIKTIEEMDITLVKGDEDQHWKALLELALRGGRKTPVSHTLANNTGPSNVADFDLNKTVALCKISFYYIERKTATQSVQEAGILICRYNSKDDNWEQESMSLFDDAGTVFSIDDTDTDASILQTTTDSLTGASYVGTMKMTSIFEVRA